MLCGDQDLSSCANGVNASDTACTDPSNTSRICVLRNASLNFVNTMTSAITSSAQLYIGVVPYVTTVNVGPLFCNGAGFNCTHMTQDACSGDFTDDRGNIGAFPNGVVGKLTNASTAVSGLMNNPGNTNDAGQTMPIRAVNADGSVRTGDIPTPSSGLLTTISAVTNSTSTPPTTLTLSRAATANSANASGTILQVGLVGNTVAGSPTVTITSPILNPAVNTAPYNRPYVGEVVTDNSASTSNSIGYTTNGPAIPANTAIKAIDPVAGTITLCNNATTTAASSSSAANAAISSGSRIDAGVRTGRPCASANACTGDGESFLPRPRGAGGCE